MMSTSPLRLTGRRSYRTRGDVAQESREGSSRPNGPVLGGGPVQPPVRPAHPRNRAQRPRCPLRLRGTTAIRIIRRDNARRRQPVETVVDRADVHATMKSMKSMKHMKTINRSARFFLHALHVLHGEGVSGGRTPAISRRGLHATSYFHANRSVAPVGLHRLVRLTGGSSNTQARGCSAQQQQ
jgi:hypothetical protein